jgi:glucokinase
MFLGIDFGGTNTKYGILNVNGDILYQGSISTLDEAGTLNPVEKIELIVKQIYENFPESINNIKGIGIAFAGFVDFKNGIVIKSPNLPVADYPLASLVSAKTGLPVFVDNDVNAYLAGEMVGGAGKNSDNAVCLAIGTGVGGAVSINGKLMRGGSSFGAEMGHMMIQMNSERKCGCGQSGCLETYASASAIIADFKKLSYRGLVSTILERTENVTVKDIFDFYHKNDPLCLRIIDDYIKYLAIGMANYIHIFNPEVFIIGGGVANGLKTQNNALFNKLISEVKRNTVSCSFDTCVFKLAELGDFSAVTGAVYLVKEGLELI